MARENLLIIDDDAGTRFPLRIFFENKGFVVQEAEDGGQALHALQGSRPDAVILDYSLPDMNALELLPRLKKQYPDLPVVVFTAHGSIEIAVKAVKEGAESLLTKGTDLPTLLLVVERMLKNSQHRKQHLLAESRRARRSHDPFLGSSRAITELEKRTRKLVGADRPLMILGETGCGKGILAKWVHENGPRSAEAFVDLNCASLSREFLESELFGHAKGAFTGAVAAKQGLLEVAHKGTVFLDEIGEMDSVVQPKILTVVEDLRFRRLGETRDRKVDVRLLAATHQDLASRVKEGRFRSDLYYRVSALPLVVPPLRQRKEDIPAMAEMLLEGLSRELGRRALHLSSAALRKIDGHSWPGNIRELRNVLEHAAILSDQEELTAADLHLDTGISTAITSTVNLTLEAVERSHIELVLRDVEGGVAEAARRLGIARSTLYDKIKRHRIVVSGF